MLKPAILFKEEIENNFKKYYYSDDMMYETGGLGNWLPDIQEEPEYGKFQYAIVDSNEKLLGYLDYFIDWYSSCAHRFRLISFDRGNPIVGRDLFNEMKKLLDDYKLHRIEWRMIGGNPAERSYDRFCKKHNGTKHILKDVIKDKYGKYHDDIIYEIINDKHEISNSDKEGLAFDVKSTIQEVIAKTLSDKLDKEMEEYFNEP